MKPSRHPIDRRHVFRINRDAGDGHTIFGQTKLAEVNFGLFDCHKIAMKHPRQPHCVKIQIGHNDGKVRVEEILRNQMRNDSGRHEVCANGDVRIELPDKLDEWTGIKAVEHETHPVGFPRFIALFVPPTEEIRRILNQASIKLRIEIPKQLVGKSQSVAVNNIADSGVLFEHFG
jgi:hypothetical protein